MPLLFAPEAELMFDWMLTDKQKSDDAYVKAKADEIFAHYLKTPFSDVQPPAVNDPRAASLQIADCLRDAHKLL